MEIRITKIDAVKALYGRSSYHQADSNGNVKWKDGHETTAEETTAINAKVVELQADFDAQSYARKREAEYPSIQECVHAILDDDTVALQEKRQAIKTKYPKS